RTGMTPPLIGTRGAAMPAGGVRQETSRHGLNRSSTCHYICFRSEQKPVTLFLLAPRAKGPTCTPRTSARAGRGQPELIGRPALAGHGLYIGAHRSYPAVQAPWRPARPIGHPDRLTALATRQVLEIGFTHNVSINRCDRRAKYLTRRHF